MLMYVVTAVCRCEGGWRSLLFLFLFYFYFYSYSYSILLLYSIFEDVWYTAPVSPDDDTFQEIAVLRWDTHPAAFWRLPTKMASNAGRSNAFNPFHFWTWDLTSTNRDQHPTFFQPLTRLSTGGPRRWCAVFRVIYFSRPVYQASVSMLYIYVSTSWLLFALENAFVSGTR